ncbi:hypothetical protein BDW59DRAFT_155654 [Aspergillus cavernicola]|uniref:NACHT-NTPase and P-loop NTPases N-terminal domain-containing protein n=1 Tax=Aspergillus cavernicola TaxID=176166 RepID=A0ABR4H3I4_9EURO
MAKVISQLSALISAVEGAVNKIDSLSPPPDQLSKLTDLTLRLTEAASCLERKTESAKYSRATRVDEEIEKLKQANRDSLTNGNLPKPSLLRKNVVLIFQGPNISALDRADVRTRKETTRERCAILRSLNIDGVISWAASYNPSTWAGGTMAWDVFNRLIEDIEPSGRQTYPRELIDILIKLKDDLPGNAEYELFVEGNGLENMWNK